MYVCVVSLDYLCRWQVLVSVYPSYSCEVTDFGSTHFGHYTTPTT